MKILIFPNGPVVAVQRRLSRIRMAISRPSVDAAQRASRWQVAR